MKPIQNQETEAIDLYGEVFGPVTENDQSLTIFTLVGEMPDSEPWLAIKKGYRQDALYIRVMAMIMNGVLSSKKSAFLLSRGFLERYMKDDPNFIGRETINSKEQAEIMDQLLARMNRNNAFLRQIRPPSKKGLNGHRAGVYTIASQAFLSFLDWYVEPDFQAFFLTSPKPSSNKYKNKGSIEKEESKLKLKRLVMEGVLTERDLPSDFFEITGVSRLDFDLTNYFDDAYQILQNYFEAKSSC